MRLKLLFSDDILYSFRARSLHGLLARVTRTPSLARLRGDVHCFSTPSLLAPEKRFCYINLYTHFVTFDQCTQNHNFIKKILSIIPIKLQLLYNNYIPFIIFVFKCQIYDKITKDGTLRHVYAFEIFHRTIL